MRFYHVLGHLTPTTPTQHTVSSDPLTAHLGVLLSANLRRRRNTLFPPIERGLVIAGRTRPLALVRAAIARRRVDHVR